MALPKLRRKNSTPERQVTGTSYKAAGAIKPDPVNYTELGSQSGGVIRETVPELSNRVQAAAVYRKMTRSDASVRISLRAGKAPVLGGEYYIEPYDNEPENLAIAELIDFNLFHGMTTPWLKTLELIVKMIEDGNSVFEPIWELREWAPKINAPGANRRQYTMLRKLAYRPATTVKEFVYDDNGGPVSVKQNAIDAKGNVKEVEIPIEKLVVFTFDPDGGDLEGTSILRSAYPHWYFKNTLYKIDAIQKERHGIGVPEVELLPGFTEKDVQVAHTIGRNLRTNEFSHIVRTSMMNIGFAELKGQPVNALESAMHHDNMIMKNVMVQFLNLGMEGSGGGRATGATSMDMFLKAMKYIAESICESLNMYLIPRLVAYNFATDKFPRLAVRGIGETKDIQMWMSAISNGVKTGALQPDDEFEQWVRKGIDAPRRRTPFETTTEEKPVTDNGNGNGRANAGTLNVGKSPSSGA